MLHCAFEKVDRDALKKKNDRLACLVAILPTLPIHCSSSRFFSIVLAKQVRCNRRVTVSRTFFVPIFLLWPDSKRKYIRWLWNDCSNNQCTVSRKHFSSVEIVIFFSLEALRSKVVTIIELPGICIEWCQIDNQQSPVYVVNSHFSRYPDGCWECGHNFSLVNHLYHIWELSNEVLYDPISRRVSKIWQIKVETLRNCQ